MYKIRIPPNITIVIIIGINLLIKDLIISEILIISIIILRHISSGLLFLYSLLINNIIYARIRILLIIDSLNIN